MQISRRMAECGEYGRFVAAYRFNAGNVGKGIPEVFEGPCLFPGNADLLIGRWVSARRPALANTAVGVPRVLAGLGGLHLVFECSCRTRFFDARYRPARLLISSHVPDGTFPYPPLLTVNYRRLTRFPAPKSYRPKIST